MDTFVADASVGIAWCVASQASEATNALLSDLGTGREFVIPGLWMLEVANSLLVLRRRGRLSPMELSEARRFVSDLDWRVDEEGSAGAFSQLSGLAGTHGLSVYDATYLELAIRLGHPLASRDDRLNKAARKCGVKTLL